MGNCELEAKAGLVGLRNVGNTCYINAVLQALSNCPPLVEFMRLSYAGISASNRSTEPWTAKMVAVEFGCLICLMWADCPMPPAVTPSRFLDSVRSSQPGFRVNQQQDAQEFLRFLMDKLHDALKRPIFEQEAQLLSPSLSRSSSVDSESYVTCSSGSSSSTVKAVPSTPLLTNGFREELDDLENGSSTVLPNGPLPSTASVNGDEHGSCSSVRENGIANGQLRRTNCVDRKPLRHTSAVSEVFGGKLSSCVRCLHCNHLSETTECFQDLSLSIPSKAQLEELSQGVSSLNGEGVGWLSWLASYVRQYVSGVEVTLDLCLSLFFSADRLTGDDQYQCSNCNRLRDGLKICRLLELPEILCVHIKRFRYDSMSSRKLSNVVRFPLQGLDLSPYLHKDCVSRATTYDLNAVISHHGSADGGHYTTFCYNQRNGQWYEFDDETVVGVDPFLAQNAEAYILFYQKVGDSIGDLRTEAAELQKQMESNDNLFFISTHWLTRFNTFAEPGPVNNFDFVCNHGGIISKWYPNNNDLFCPVSAAVWYFLIDCFGGGYPVCDRLNWCSDCEHYMYAVGCRRQFEISLLIRLRNALLLDADQPTRLYLVCAKWMRRWEEFLCKDSNEIPGTLDNNAVALKIGFGRATAKRKHFLLNVNEYTDLLKAKLCCAVPMQLWKLLSQLYGDGDGAELQIDESFCASDALGILTYLLRRVEAGGCFSRPLPKTAACKRHVIIAEPD